MNIIVIGTGMYVTGRGTDGYGTILPAIIEYIRAYEGIDKISMVGSNGKHSLAALKKLKLLFNKSGVSCPIEIFPKGNTIDSNQYKHVLKGITKPACAIIAVPDHLHYKIANDCLKRGLHTLVVKPLTATVKEANKLINIAQENDAYGVVEFHKRWDRQNLLLRDTFLNGKIGKPLYTWTEYSQRKSIPINVLKSWVEQTNIFQYLGVHYIDIVRFITQALPKRVMAIGQKTWLLNLGIDNYDAIQCIVEWEMPDGLLFSQTLLVNWIDPETSNAMSNQNIKFVGTKGRCEADQKNRGISFYADDSQIEAINPDFCKSYKENGDKNTWKGYGIDSITSFLLDVRSIIKEGKKPIDFEGLRPTFKESLISTAVIEAVNKSLTNDNRWNEINQSFLL